MSIKEFHESAAQLMDIVERFINKNLSENGITSSDCQRMFLINTLAELRYAFNGTQAEDLINETVSHASGFIEFDMKTADALNTCINVATMNGRAIDDDVAALAQSASIAITDAMIEHDDTDTQSELDARNDVTDPENLEKHESTSPRRISDNWVTLSLRRKAAGQPCYWNAEDRAMTADIDMATRYRDSAVNEIGHYVRQDSDLCWVNAPLMECGTEWPELTEILDVWSIENDLKPESADDMLATHQDTLTRAQQDWLKQFLSQWFT